MSLFRTLAMTMGLAAALAVSGCDDGTNTGNTGTTGTTGTTTPGTNTTGTTTTGTEDDHDDHGHGTGVAVELGEAAAGPFTIRVSRDEGEMTAGGEALVDVWVTGGDAAAVRFWVGTQDGAGSVKALGENENADEPNHYHAHAEIPDPMPAGAMLWVEVEDSAGAMHTASFPLNM